MPTTLLFDPLPAPSRFSDLPTVLFTPFYSSFSEFLERSLLRDAQWSKTHTDGAFHSISMGILEFAPLRNNRQNLEIVENSNICRKFQFFYLIN